MTNPKLERVTADIAKAKAKILEWQSKLRAYERQKIELENEGFISIIRSEHISDADLSALMLALRNSQPKTAEPDIMAAKETVLEETRYASDET